MLIKMNLLENSCDYLMNALDLYKIADEGGTHLKDKANIKNKAKWKLAFVSLVQALELILKFGLYTVNPVLVYANIDSEKLSLDKTIAASSILTRLTNIKNNPYNKDEQNIIEKCFRIRNQFIHYDVEIKTEEIKNKFATLYNLYIKAYICFCDGNCIDLSDEQRRLGEELEFYASELMVFRGQEILKTQIESYKAEIDKYSKLDCFITSDGEQVKRIAFGEENYFFLHNGNDNGMSTLYDYEYCDDCGAAQNEYHLELCDLEVCPICHGQKLSCNCDLSFPDD